MTIVRERIGRDVFAEQVADPRKPRGAGQEHDGQRLLSWLFTISWLMGNLVSFKPFRSGLLILPVLAVVCFLVSRFDRRASDVRVPAILAGFIFWCVLSYGWSLSPKDGSHQMPEYVAMLVTGLVCGLVLTPQGLLASLARASRILICIVGVSLVVDYHAATAPPALDPVPGWHGPVGGKNGLGLLMAIALAAFAFEDRRVRARRLWIVAAVVLLVGAQSGAGWCLSLLAVGMLLWRAALSRQVNAIGKVLLKVLAATCGIASLTFLFVDLPAATGVIGKSPNFTGRTSIWTSVIDAIPEHLLTGTGYAGVWFSDGGATAKLTRAIGFRAYEAHQGYLDVTLQLGAVGALLFLTLLIATLCRLIPNFATRPRAEAGLLVLVLALVLENFAESMWTGFGVLLFAAIATVVIGHGAGRSDHAGRLGLPEAVSRR